MSLLFVPLLFTFSNNKVAVFAFGLSSRSVSSGKFERHPRSTFTMCNGWMSMFDLSIRCLCDGTSTWQKTHSTTPQDFDSTPVILTQPTCLRKGRFLTNVRTSFPLPSSFLYFFVSLLFLCQTAGQENCNQKKLLPICSKMQNFMAFVFVSVFWLNRITNWNMSRVL